jgi:hypothetical protein
MLHRKSDVGQANCNMTSLKSLRGATGEETVDVVFSR